MVRGEKNRLQIIKGSRGSGTDWYCHPPNWEPSLDQEGTVPCSSRGSYGPGAIAAVLTAMEHRVSSLLDDRRRLGRDLHDCILQSIYAIGLHLEAARHSTTDQSPASNRLHDSLVEQVNKLIKEVRAMIESLEAGTIQEFDLAAELLSLKETYEQAGRLHIELDLDSNALKSLTSEEQREILNIVREALSNCARHAAATHVAVTLRMWGSSIRVSIADDGCGFTLSDNCRRGYGLTNMEARARRLGARMSVRSENGRGTTVTVDVSLSAIETPR